MDPESKTHRRGTAARRLAPVLLSVLTVPAIAGAQGVPADHGAWTLTAATGVFYASSPLVKASEANTELTAGPSVALEARYRIGGPAAVYLNGTVAFGSVRLGTSIQPAVIGPSHEVTIAAGTAGLLLSAADWFGEHLQPTLRVGGGLKWYGFDLTGAESQARPTGEFGLGLRGVGGDAIEGLAEVRYLLSSFDQSKLPTQGIATQEQRQNDFVFSIGIGIRP